MVSAQLSSLWYIPFHRQLIRVWSVGLTRLYNSDIVNRIRWGLHDVSMARLYVHKTALLIVRKRVRRHIEWIVKLSALWYAQLCTTWGRHVYLLCLPVVTCALLTARLFVDEIASILMLLQVGSHARVA